MEFDGVVDRGDALLFSLMVKYNIAKLIIGHQSKYSDRQAFGLVENLHVQIASMRNDGLDHTRSGQLVCQNASSWFYPTKLSPSWRV